MKKLLFKWRLRLLLKGVDLRKGLERWLFSSLSEDERSVKHRKECDQIMLSLASDERLALLKWFQLKINYLVAENTKDKTEEMQYRIFQSLLEHNQIKALHEAERMRREIAEQK